MKKIEVRQNLMNHPWSMIVPALLFAIPLAIFWVNSKGQLQNNMGELWGVLIPLLITSLVTLAVFRIKNLVIIRTDGVKFRFSPFLKSTQFLPVERIKDWKIIDYTWRNFHGLGYRRSFRGNYYIVMRWGKALQVTTTKNKKYYFGIDRPNRVRKFIMANWGEK